MEELDVKGFAHAEAARRDAEVEELASHAEYAGDPDPYVKPREYEDDEPDDA